MRKSIYFLLVSMIMSFPLYAGTAGSVPINSLEDDEKERTSFTPTPLSSDLSLEENSSQPSKLAGLSSSITGTFDAWFPDSAFKRKIKEAGFDPQLIDLYKKFSPTFERLAQYCSDEVIQNKSLISKELFKRVLIGMHENHPLLPLLLKASADLGSNIGIYTFSYKRCTLDPYIYYAEWLYDGMGGFKKDEREALNVMYKYGSAGHEGLRRMHLIKLYRAGRGSTSTEGLIYFRKILQEYVDQKSEIATRIAEYFTNKKKSVAQLTMDDLTKPNLEDFQQTVFQSYSHTHLPT
ncbi:MAG: hypothetical protein JNJ47_04235 [Alphaproteobacteria bacterium]|nr:hypothetical protein [Alphaproteobacteria bacterium]